MILVEYAGATAQRVDPISGDTWLHAGCIREVELEVAKQLLALPEWRIPHEMLELLEEARLGLTDLDSNRLSGAPAPTVEAEAEVEAKAPEAKAPEAKAPEAEAKAPEAEAKAPEAEAKAPEAEAKAPNVEADAEVEADAKDAADTTAPYDKD